MSECWVSVLWSGVALKQAHTCITDWDSWRRKSKSNELVFGSVVHEDMQEFKELRRLYEMANLPAVPDLAVEINPGSWMQYVHQIIKEWNEKAVNFSQWIISHGL
ncbi:hypothetical protein L210DRAFT_3507637 [Boletus edulis BED1]|uniref:Uncharacterized protein n=1 Tax=Boletus edulis BED1 TaxID=1328754 RepID=A0AAD4BJM4_BOLED|nr:hypothetical protein L210DRAFT_3507637 [Boletus edulis BED1]